MATRLAVFELTGREDDKHILQTVESLVRKGGQIVVQYGKETGAAVRLPRLPQFSKKAIVVALP